MEEVWKSIPGYEGLYEASDAGRIRSLPQRQQHREYVLPGRVLVGWATHGYRYVHLWANGRSRPRRVHRLILEAFVGPQPPKMQACHANGVRDDNRLLNLRWGSWADNHLDRVAHGTTNRGEQSPNAKLSSEQVLCIRADPRKQRDIAREFGVTQAQISLIKRRKQWAHI